MALKWFKKKKDKAESTDAQAEATTAVESVESPVLEDDTNAPVPEADPLDTRCLGRGTAAYR